MAETYQTVQRPERVSSAAHRERSKSATSGSGRSDLGTAATSEVGPVHERGGADELDLSRSATDDEKASVGRRTPGTAQSVLTV